MRRHPVTPMHKSQQDERALAAGGVLRRADTCRGTPQEPLPPHEAQSSPGVKFHAGNHQVVPCTIGQSPANHQKSQRHTSSASWKEKWEYSWAKVAAMFILARACPTQLRGPSLKGNHLLPCLLMSMPKSSTCFVSAACALLGEYMEGFWLYWAPGWNANMTMSMRACPVRSRCSGEGCKMKCWQHVQQ